MQTRSKTILSRSAGSNEPTFETRRSRRLQLIEPTVANIAAIEVADWLKMRSNTNSECDNDNDSTSTYNTEDAEQELYFNIDYQTQQQQQHQPKYAVDIDFDDASRAWNANKRSIGNGSYRYIRNRMPVQTNRISGVRTRSQTAAAASESNRK